jgi:hypothetical protein
MPRFYFVQAERTDAKETRRNIIPLILGLFLFLPAFKVFTRVAEVIPIAVGVRGQIFCPFLSLSGLPCPFCGLTRSLTSLLDGDISQAIWFHPLGPAFWGAVLFLGVARPFLALLRQKMLLGIRPRAAVISMAVFVLIFWSSNILLGHH